MSLNEIKKIMEEQRVFRRSFKYRVNVCCSSGCLPFGALKVLNAFKRAVKKLGVEKECYVARTGCPGTCYLGPVAVVNPGNFLYQNLKLEDPERIVNQHIVIGKPVEELLYKNSSFFKKQVRIILEKAGKIDPFQIKDYLALGGYSALIKSLTEWTPEQVISQVSLSGLRGRGGAGFPTGKKWSFVASAQGKPKYLIGNLDEGDPGVFANRTLAEADPHAIIEGALIAAYAVGVDRGYIYVRSEYPLAIKSLEKAVNQAQSLNLLGENILEQDFSFDLKLAFGAGAFIAGEETGIISSIEGERATPRPRPPYPANSGLWGKPTLVHNVETLANIPVIINKGYEWFHRIGTEKCSGTKCFSLTGKVVNPGLIEVPMGITLKEVVYEIGGGVADGKKFKAVQVGGPSGGCLPEKLLHLQVDYESLTEAGAIMGSGGIVVMDEETCMVKTAQFFTEFCIDESCGKCVPCRAGLPQINNLLKKIVSGEGDLQSLLMLNELGNLLKDTSLCGLGQTAANPVQTTLKYFKEEYLSHLEGFCQSHKCFGKKEYE